MLCAFTALQMEKHSPITLVHGIGLKCEQATSMLADIQLHFISASILL